MPNSIDRNANTPKRIRRNFQRLSLILDKATTIVKGIIGTANRITVTATDPEHPVIDIAATYIGQVSITTLGTVTTGTWNAGTIAINHGGTGQTSASAAFNALAPSQSGKNGDFLTTDGSNTSWAAVTQPTAANPTASVTLSVQNGVLATFMRSDASPALDQSIAPTWTGIHIHSVGSNWLINDNAAKKPLVIRNASGQHAGAHPLEVQTSGGIPALYLDFDSGSETQPFLHVSSTGTLFGGLVFNNSQGFAILMNGTITGTVANDSLTNSTTGATAAVSSTSGNNIFLKTITGRWNFGDTIVNNTHAFPGSRTIQDFDNGNTETLTATRTPNMRFMQAGGNGFFWETALPITITPHQAITNDSSPSASSKTSCQVDTSTGNGGNQNGVSWNGGTNAARFGRYLFFAGGDANNTNPNITISGTITGTVNGDTLSNSTSGGTAVVNGVAGSVITLQTVTGTWNNGDTVVNSTHAFPGARTITLTTALGGTLVLRGGLGTAGTPGVVQFQTSAGTATADFKDTEVDIHLDVKLDTAGKGLYVKEGTNATMGKSTLVAGTVTVSTTKVTANSRVMLTGQNSSGTHGELTISARTAGTSFVITSSNASDTRDIAWIIFEPA